MVHLTLSNCNVNKLMIHRQILTTNITENAQWLVMTQAEASISSCVLLGSEKQV